MDRMTDKWTNRRTNKHKIRKTDGWIESQTGICVGNLKDGQTKKQTDRQTDRQGDKRTDGWTDRQTDS